MVSSREFALYFFVFFVNFLLAFYRRVRLPVQKVGPCFHVIMEVR